MGCSGTHYPATARDSSVRPDDVQKILPWASPNCARLGLLHRIKTKKQMVVWDFVRLDPHTGEVDPSGFDSFH